MLPDPPPDYSLRVWVCEYLDYYRSDKGKESLVLHERINEFMNKAKLGVPEDRIRYFKTQWENGPVIVGWKGMISDVKPIKGGYTVTLLVSAVNERGSPDNIHFFEHYSINAGKVRYRGYTPPAPYLKMHEW